MSSIVKLTDRIPVAILGCTGIVGQRFIELLSYPPHPLFQIVALAASQNSAGRVFGSLGIWRRERSIPSSIADLTVSDCSVDSLIASGARIVFSALDSSVAGTVELSLARAGFAVFSNAGNHRMNPSIPIVVTQVNSHHLNSSILDSQRSKLEFPSSGFIVTNSNCTSAGLVTALRPIQLKFGLKQIFVATLQAVSGAGIPGVSSFDIIDNVIPFIAGEEEKVETEPLKILGEFNSKDEKFDFAEFSISAQCHRVAVLDGHTVSISFSTKLPATREELILAMKEFRSEAQ